MRSDGGGGAAFVDSQTVAGLILPAGMRKNSQPHVHKHVCEITCFFVTCAHGNISSHHCFILFFSACTG